MWFKLSPQKDPVLFKAKCNSRPCRHVRLLVCTMVHADRVYCVLHASHAQACTPVRDCKDLDFKKFSPGADLPEQLDVVTHLLKLDVGIIYRDITQNVDPKMLRFGFIPLMASCSDGQIGALNAEYFASVSSRFATTQ